LVDDLGIREKVNFLGHRHDIAELMGRSQLFALITHWEGFPRSILEAMRSGLPVLASEVAGVPEAVMEGQTGLLCRRGDVDQVREKLRVLLATPALRQTLGEQARRKYEDSYTFEAMYRNTCKVYQQVLR